MPNLTATSISLPAGGGEFKLERLTIGVFRNDQPTHRLQFGNDATEDKPLVADQGWILPPGAEGLCLYDDSLDVMMVEVQPDVLEEVGLTKPADLAPVVGDFDPLVHQLAMSAEGFNEGGTLYRETMHRALAAQLSKVLQPVHQAAAQIADARLRRVVEYIHDNLAEDLTLNFMADLAAMSGYHFARAFKVATGKSPLQYVIAARIEMAQTLLKTTGLPVADICFRTGYNDVSRFGQHFKRAVGVTPAAFRNA